MFTLKLHSVLMPKQKGLHMTKEQTETFVGQLPMALAVFDEAGTLLKLAFVKDYLVRFKLQSALKKKPQHVHNESDYWLVWDTDTLEWLDDTVWGLYLTPFVFMAHM